VQRLRHESLPCPARGLELVAYRQDVAVSGTAEPGFELELNTGASMEFRATWRPEDRPEEDGLFWYGLDRSLLHASGLRLVGPPAAETFSALDPAELASLLATSLRWWIARTTPSGAGHAPGAEDAVLGACRALVRIRYGEWLSKVDAGMRLLEDGQGSSVIEEAIAARSGGPPPSADSALRFQRQVLEEISGVHG
jgi:hypothetical protein